MTQPRVESELIQRLRDHVTGPPEAEHYALRRRMLFVGKRLFAHFGYQGTSIVDIARAADVSEAELMRHFDGKLKVMKGIFDDEWKTIGPRMEDVVLGAPNAREAILEIFAMLTHMLDKDRALARLWLFDGRLLLDEHGEPVTPAGLKNFSDLITRLVVRSQMEKTCPPAFHPRVMASMLISGMEGLIRDWLLSEDPKGETPYTGAQLITVFDAVVTGLKP